MATLYETHKKEELRENLVSIVGLWPDVASRLGITIKQAATFVEDKFFLLELVMYTDHEYTGLWGPTEGFVGERTTARVFLMDAWSSCESKGWTEESRTEWEFMCITHSEANQIWEEVEKICKPKPQNMRGIVKIEPSKMTVLETIDSRGAGEHMTNREIFDRMRVPAKPMPRLRLIPITTVIQAVSDLSEGKASIPELFDALHGGCDYGKLMLYRGIGEGLADAFDGNSYGEYSGLDERVGIFSELFNSRYWKKPDVTIRHASEDFQPDEFLMEKEDSLKLALWMWEFFCPVQEFVLDDFITFRDQPRKLSPEFEPIPIPHQSQNNDIDPSDLPHELDAANMAFRAVLNGHGEQAATFKNRLIDYLKANYSHLTSEAVDRIAIVANPNKAPGRKKRDAK